MKVLLDVSEKALRLLAKKAESGGWSRKKYMELVLNIDACKADPATKRQLHKPKTKKS